jgi:hypothetical protein
VEFAAAFNHQNASQAGQSLLSAVAVDDEDDGEDEVAAKGPSKTFSGARVAEYFGAAPGKPTDASATDDGGDTEDNSGEEVAAGKAG